jgi:surface polysaccharide O-acyltransferase-like enzyme
LEAIETTIDGKGQSGKSKMNVKERKKWVDNVRCFAIVCVVLCHCTEGIYSINNLNFISGLSFQSRLFAFLSFTCGRLGVPMFLFMTGYLLLDRTYNDEEIKSFWKKNFIPLLLTTEVWILFYRIFLSWFDHTDFSVKLLIKNLLFTEAVGLSHMWYMPMILGAYIFIPFVAIFLKNVNERMLKFPVAVVFACLFVMPVANVIRVWFGSQGQQSLVCLDFSGGVYGLYLIFGYLTKKGIFKCVKCANLIIIGSGCFGCAVMLQMLSCSKGYSYAIWYNNGLLFAASIAIFELFSRIAEKIPAFAHRIILNLSRCSFGIYLIHNPIRLLLQRYLNFSGVLPVKVMMLFLVTFVLSWMIVYFLSKIPKVGKNLFYMK